MKTLILLSHGSRHKASNDEMIGLASTMSTIDNHAFDRVVCAFQQFARPAFMEALDDVVADGATAVVIYPLFLAAGSHVRHDVPQLIDQARNKYPHIAITTLPHLGDTPELAAFLLKQAIRHD